MNERFAKLSKPYLVWLYVLAVVPAIFMCFMMFVNTEGLDFEGLTLTFENFTQFAEASTIVAFKNSFLLAALSTVICIILGYLVAYKLFRSNFRNKFLILVILVLPMWSNLLLRTEALANIMERHSIITSIIAKIKGVDANSVEGPEIRGTMLAVIIGLVVTYVPFMVMPIYNALEKIEPSIEEAALDLGLTDFKKFWKVIFPMSIKGIVTGSIMVFLPSLSGFAIPQILSKGNVVMIGNVIEQLFRNMNYNIGSLLAIVILLFILLSITLVNKFDKEGETLL